MEVEQYEQHVQQYEMDLINGHRQEQQQIIVTLIVKHDTQRAEEHVQYVQILHE